MSRPKVLCIGEAMIEMAPVEGGRYKRGFAGDTFNTAWHMAQVLGERGTAGFVSRVGNDAVSDDFVAELLADGLSVDGISRSPDQTMGLYLISLDGVERSFQYWRSASAARGLANDASRLAADLTGADVIHLSGITVAILPPKDRASLLSELKRARDRGALISFDPNVRPALWSGLDEVREVLPKFFTVADILLPSFDDETAVWADRNPKATLERLGGFGASEIVVKDGARDVQISHRGVVSAFDTPEVAGIRDTTGAGDAFNAGYLAARTLGQDPEQAVRLGQKLSALVLRCAGARADKAAMADFRAT